MTDQEFQQYRDGRYQEALKFYDDRSQSNKFWHRFCSIYILLVSVAITPILTLIPNPLWGIIDGKTLAAILAPTVALVSALSNHFRCHENWLRYRSTWDALKHELPHRDASAGPYKGSPNRNSLFVERVEDIIGNEGMDWLSCHAKKDSVGPAH
jgi:Na+/melibiose symporter-like transporter